MIYIAIIDDDEKDIELLVSNLKRYFDDKNMAISIQLYRSAKHFLERFEKQFNLIFFDVEMPELDGINLAREIRKKDDAVRIIFVSWHPKYALDGYGLNALSFLVKPITYQSLSLKMNGILPYIAEDIEKQITFKYRDEIKAVYIKNIVSVTVYGHYLEIRLCDGTSFENRGTLAELLKQLPTPLFTRCSHSDIVNIKFIKEIKDNVVVMIDNRIIPISRNKKKDFMGAVLSHFGTKNGTCN